MAASMVLSRCRLSLQKLSSSSLVKPCLSIQHGTKNPYLYRTLLTNSQIARGQKFHPGRRKGLAALVGAVFTGTASFVWVQQQDKVVADTGSRPTYVPSRSVKSATDNSGLKLTLYQYQTCPFCCKVRAYLDYRGFSYDVIEVNSVWRTQTKWSKYRKVPILVVEGQGPDGYLQLNDSSVISSVLESYLINRSDTLETLKSYYPIIESRNQRKKIEYDFPNRYFLMYGENKPDGTADSRKEERKWRHWADAVLVHTLSPNVYRTPSEALQAFRYFSEAGDWEQHFSYIQRQIVIHVGAVAMYFIGKSLIKKYNLKEDVRESLYDACHEWTKALGKKRNFMGGHAPNMADVAVYGVLSSIEGCQAFEDLLQNTNIGSWYRQMKSSVNGHHGAIIMN